MKIMRFTKKFLIIAASALLLIPTSCNEDILYLEPYNSLSYEVVFNGVDDFETALMGVYSGLRSSSYYGKNLTIIPDIMTDNAYAKSGFTNSYGYVHQWNIQPGTSEFENFFYAGYIVITRASNVINYSNGFTPDPDTEEERARLRQIRGEAYLARAMAHFDLLRTFGPRYDASTASSDLGIPIITNSEVGTPARANVEAVYNQIFSDISNALERMEETDWEKGYRFTPAAAYALLSRIHLTRGEWEEAADYAGDVIEMTQYSLVETQTALRNMYINDDGSEIIFQLAIKNTTEFSTAIGTEYIGTQPGVRINPNYLVTPELVNLYDPFEDKRFLAFIKTNVLLTGTSLRGITNEKQVGRSDLARGVNSAKPFMLAEMYLNKAEAHAMNNEFDLAQGAIDALLSKRINNHTSTDLTGDDLIDFIRLERRKEFAFEGHYWFDLKRWGEGFTRYGNPLSNFPNDLTIIADDYRWQWPIPQHEMNANKNMKQNDGY